MSAAPSIEEGRPEPGPHPEPKTGNVSLRPLVGIWLIALALLGAISALWLKVGPTSVISNFFFLHQDLPVAVTSLAMFGLIASPWRALRSSAVEAIERGVNRRAWLIVGLAAGSVAVIAFAGWWLVYQTYPLSMDEFWADFDAGIFAHGRLLAPVSDEWRPFVQALQPMWRLQVPGDAAWASTYLPVNAALRALFEHLGSAALAGPVCAALSIVLTYALARDFWPSRRDAAVVAAVLMATSSQLIVAAMSPYAMSAHCAFNLLWLWLFRRPGAFNQGLAILVAFAATGLHQFIFHPLFAAPFVLQLWLTRQWRRAAWQTLAYGWICLFWICWWPILFAALGMPAAAGQAAARGATAQAVAMAFNPVGLFLMALNLIRFMVWQNPLTVPLAWLGIRAAFKDWRGPMLPLAAGLILAVDFLLAITPFQGHGWGYRYLHGFLGSLCLLAAFAWIRLTEGADEVQRAKAWGAFGAACAAAVLVWLPMRLIQVHDFIRPYARAHAAIEAADADVVVIDPAGFWYTQDLIRNDPFLTRGPKVMARPLLTPRGAALICRRYRVALFGPPQSAAFGIRRVEGVTPEVADLATPGLAPFPCGRPLPGPSTP